MTMKPLIFGLAVAAIAVAAGGAQAADAPYRYREHIYERPVPRVYFQPVRPTAVCRTVFVRGERDWPREQGRPARCTRFD